MKTVNPLFLVPNVAIKVKCVYNYCVSEAMSRERCTPDTPRVGETIYIAQEGGGNGKK